MKKWLSWIIVIVVADLADIFAKAQMYSLLDAEERLDEAVKECPKIIKLRGIIIRKVMNVFFE